MHLYHLLLQEPTSINKACVGCFSGIQKQQQIAVSRINYLELYSVDGESQTLKKMLSVQSFGVVRDMIAFKLTGSIQDYLAVVSDSGKIVILEYSAASNSFNKLHSETYGRSGCRRIVPGEMLAADPMGRALCTAAIERQKLVYVMNRDNKGRLTISSPLEAHRPKTITQEICGLEVGFENPVIACLELDYGEFEDDDLDKIDQGTQLLTYYELDLGLNHVVRKSSEKLDIFCNKLIPIPGGDEGPGGVLICGEGQLIYKNMDYQGTITCPIPRRKSTLNVDKEPLIICTAHHKTKSKYFLLVQTEDGDVFKVMLPTEDEIVSSIDIKYFDTLPPANSMCILRSGLLFVAAEFGDHHLYQIVNLGDNDDRDVFSSSQNIDRFFFSPLPLTNLSLVDSLMSLSPLVSMKINDYLGLDTPQILSFCGRSSRSAIKMLKHGLELQNIATSTLPGTPIAVWTVKKNEMEDHDLYIIISFINATLILAVQNDTIEDVSDSGFLSSTPTLAVQQMGSDSFVQVYPEGIRHIKSDKRINEWKISSDQKIVHACLSRTQVVIVSNTSEITYFEMDSSEQLNEYSEKLMLGDLVISVAIGRVKPGELRAPFLAVGFRSNIVRVFSLMPNDCLKQICLQALPDTPTSLCLCNVGAKITSESYGSRNRDRNVEEQHYSFSELNLFIGLQNGVLLRTSLDENVRGLTDTRTRYLGSEPVKIFPIVTQGMESIVAFSKLAYIGYVHQNQFQIIPLSLDKPHTHIAPFSSGQCPEGMIGVSENSMSIISCSRLGQKFHTSRSNVYHTPRKFANVPGSQTQIISIETDHRAFTSSVLQTQRKQVAKEVLEAAGSEEEKKLALNVAQEILDSDSKFPREVFGETSAPASKWASLIRVFDVESFQTLLTIPLNQDDAAQSIGIVKFQSRNDLYLIVGCSVGLQLNPRKGNGGAIYTFKLMTETVDNRPVLKLAFVHRTVVEEAVGAIHSYNGRVIISVGRLARIYDMGKKKLLLKTENRQIPNFIIDIKSVGNRIICADIQESLHYMHYNAKENILHRYADDFEPRYVTTFCPIDYYTYACGDKFGNITIFRLDKDITENMDLDPTGFRDLWANRNVLNGAPQKSNIILNFYVGSVVTSLQKISLVAGSPEVIVYSTIDGQIGVLAPVTSKHELDFLQSLELHMRNEPDTVSIVGKSHFSFRSMYYVCKGVVDSELCDMFAHLPYAKQREIADELERTPKEVLKKLENIRSRFAF